MRELKTLKDFEDDGTIAIEDFKAVKQEAIKWAKELRFRRAYQEQPLKDLCKNSLIESERWIMYFFNIIEEDLK